MPSHQLISMNNHKSWKPQTIRLQEKFQSKMFHVKSILKTKKKLIFLAKYQRSLVGIKWVIIKKISSNPLSAVTSKEAFWCFNVYWKSYYEPSTKNFSNKWQCIPPTQYSGQKLWMLFSNEEKKVGDEMPFILKIFLRGKALRS